MGIVKLQTFIAGNASIVPVGDGLPDCNGNPAEGFVTSFCGGVAVKSRDYSYIEIP